MNYPLISEYIEAIKSAEENFDELSYLRPVLGDDGLPIMSAGGFSVVFKMKNEQSGKFYAIKCFTKEQKGRAEAYCEIAKELEKVFVPYLTSFRYLDKELFVDTDQTTETEFPVLLMDWVEGKTLDKYLREIIDDKYALEMLAYRFSQLAQWLIPQPFAHGDLKPDNILVRKDGSLVLVDYDGMYVPAMKGQKARELGSPDYRHPQRTEKYFDEHIDDFSTVVITLSLKIISINPLFVNQYDSNDGLLFNKKDYDNLSECGLMDEIKRLLGNKIVEYYYGLFIVCHSLGILTNSIDFLQYITLPDDHSISFYPDIFKTTFDIKAPLYTKKKLIAQIKKAASRGDIEAMLHLAWCFEVGKVMKINREKASYWYKKAAMKGSARAQYWLGVKYVNGNNKPHDDLEAIKWLSLASMQNNSAALRRLGRYYYRGEITEQNFEKAINCYRKLSETGDSSSIYKLGICYYYGQGVGQNYLKSAELFSKVEKKHRGIALLCLAYLYEKGLGVQQNYAKAIKLYSQIKDGDADVQVRLGLYYFNGWGVEKDYNKAFQYFKDAETASVLDDCIPKICLANCYAKGLGVEQDLNKAYELYESSVDATEQVIIDRIGLKCVSEKYSFSQLMREALEHNDKDAQRKIGHCYFYGFGVKEDENKAVEWYSKAANNGDSESLCFLWLTNIHDHKIAFERLTIASDLNNVEAKSLLADFYYGGWGIPENSDIAVSLYLDAAKAGEIKAMCNLGFCYVRATGVSQNFELAVEWFTKYVEKQNEESIKYNMNNPMGL